jgi:D-alanyl-D-alanine carboxypeptidase
MKYYLWLVKNSHLYGWHNTYQKWVAIDGYEIEPWHWRYLWVEFATYLYENNMTIAEYAFTHWATPENWLLEVGGKD